MGKAGRIVTKGEKYATSKSYHWIDKGTVSHIFQDGYKEAIKDMEQEDGLQAIDFAQWIVANPDLVRGSSAHNKGHGWWSESKEEFYTSQQLYDQWQASRK